MTKRYLSCVWCLNTRLPDMNIREGVYTPTQSASLSAASPEAVMVISPQAGARLPTKNFREAGGRSGGGPGSWSGDILR